MNRYDYNEGIISVIRSTALILNCALLIYLVMFYVFDLKFLLNIVLIQLALSLMISYFVIFKNKFYSLLVFYANFSILFSCCYFTYVLGWGYGFTFVIMLLISLGYIQNFKNSLISILIGGIETIIFFILLWTSKDIPNYENPYMHIINSINVILMVMLVLIFVKISDRENAKLLKKLGDKKEILQYKAENDYLTNLLNRRAMNDILATYYNKLLNKEIQSLAIAIGDIDNFKKINDTYGHNFGDLVLKNISKCIKDQFCENETTYASRWGGEEFLILFINYELNEVEKCMEQCRTSISKLQHKDETNDVSTTITFGVSYTKKTFKLDTMITKADMALYSGKDSGKNKTIVIDMD